MCFLLDYIRENADKGNKMHIHLFLFELIAPHPGQLSKTAKFRENSHIKSVWRPKINKYLPPDLFIWYIF